MKYKILILAIMSALLVSCEKDFSEANPYQAIVEGYLHAGRTVTLNINRQKIFNSDDTTFVNPINDLVITFTDLTDNISEILEETEDGVYESVMSVKEGNEYKFEFEYAGNKVWATTSIPAAPQNFTCDAEDGRLQHTNRLSEESDTVRTINYTWDNPDSDYHLFYINNFETWTSYIYNYYKPTQRYLTSDPQNDTIHSVNSLGFYMFGRHHMILFKVNQEFIDLYYYQSTGSQTLVNPPTNINNGYGIFTGINSDTLILTLY